MNVIRYQISGMTCGGCVNRVKQALAPLAEDVQVTLTPPAVTLTNPSQDINQLNQTLKTIGKYTLTAELGSNFAPEAKQAPQDAPKSWLATYRPLLLVFAYILLICLGVEYTHGDFSLSRFMPNFMAGFFLCFYFFKLLDLAGFANSYAMYDLLAKRVPAYGFVYPFIELGLGIGYLLNGQSPLLNWLTLIIMTFSTLGVLQAVFKRQKIRCACLGAVFNLPMSTVTIIEDLLMVLMAAWMLLA